LECADLLFEGQVNVERVDLLFWNSAPPTVSTRAAGTYQTVSVAIKVDQCLTVRQASLGYLKARHTNSYLLFSDPPYNLTHGKLTLQHIKYLLIFLITLPNCCYPLNGPEGWEVIHKNGGIWIAGQNKHTATAGLDTAQ
jgi:hypothetical protein